MFSKKKFINFNSIKQPSLNSLQKLFSSNYLKQLKKQVIKLHNKNCNNRLNLTVEYIKHPSKYWYLRYNINNLKINCNQCNKDG